MKQLKLLFVLLALSLTVRAQNSINAKLYAPALKDTLEYTVYFPADWEGWDATIKHPVIYAITYGMMNGDYLTAQVSYFRKARYAMPNSLIVVINADMDMMGYSYQTGLLSTKGLNFVSTLKNELIPAVERKYHTSPFRTYIGHSFAASFANYLFLNEPGMFNGYILLAPEKIGAEHPPFHLNQKARDYYNQNYTFYYAAVGLNDMQRRRDYAREIGHEVAQLDSSHFFFRCDSIARADHDNILTLSIDFALKYIYQFYSPYSGKNEPDVVKDLEAVSQHIKQLYGIEPEKNFTFYSPFTHEAITNKDTAGLVKVLRYFTSDRLKGWNLMQFGSFCLELNLKPQAAQYFNLAINKIRRNEMQLQIGPPNLITCYNNLAFQIYNNQPLKAWGYLQQSLAVAKSKLKYAPADGMEYYNLGKFSALYNYKVQEGLQYLLYYQTQYYQADDDIANYYIAKNYVWLNQPQKARPYLQQALKTNPNNQAAANLLKQLE